MTKKRHSSRGPTSSAFDTVHHTLDGSRLSLASLDRGLGSRVAVELSATVWDKVVGSAERVAKIAAGAKAAYGINTGFGPLCTTRIAPEKLFVLQRNLILSHAMGVGPPAPPEIVRWMMLFKVHALTHGVSGISRKTLECLIALLNADILPVIPTQGSLGASGDLAPLAHMVLPMLGLGDVSVDGRTQPACDVLARHNVEPIVLGPKEGLALVNGTQFMSAYAAAIVVRAQRLARHADLFASMSLEALACSVQPFDRRLHELRPHAGAIESAENVRRLLADSEILKSHADCDRVQDPYSIRCVPQVHGASRDAIRHTAGVVEDEINAVTDNPVIFDDGTVISGGLFHGQPLALVLDYIAIALAELASISERRSYLLLSGTAELPPFLMEQIGVNSGFMVAQYVAAALVSENKGLCTPASVDSIPTSMGQEDHVSMGARAATKCWQVLENAETTLAIEQMLAAQAIDFRKGLLPGMGPRIAHERIRQHIDHADADRLFGKDLETSLTLLRSQEILTAVQEKLGPLK